MAIAEIQKVQSMTDPLKRFMFHMVLAETRGGFINAENFELQCTAYDYPGYQFTKTSVTLGAIKRTDAAIQDRSGAWNTSMVETWDATVDQEFSAWANIAHNPITGVIQPSRAYKTSARISIIDGDFNDIVVKSLKGLWPETYKSNGFDSSNSGEAVAPTITWSYDYWE